ncbi:MAG: amidohydrolase 2 [Ktedonobacterales bacterium]|jgi:predicted TIM-barrel fold metal-dependent hydrolase|nr:MAG: amidohydrolase 2 [Ktedonobacterales bacterium]
MPRAIDFHVHLPITEFMEVAIGQYRAAAEQYFRSEVKLRDIEEIADYYAEREIVGVLLAWDAETATGQKPLRNDTVAEIVRRFPQQFVGFASVDPHKGDRAITEAVRAVRDLGLSGMKFHPGVQAFYPNDRRFYPLFEQITALGVPALFHTGTNGLGAGMPGGGGIKLDYTRPIYLDSLAADFPALTIIGAHPSWPWEQEMIAILQHKPNVYNDLSGWLPKYIPPALLKEAAGRLNGKFLFGSDYPFITPERWLSQFDALDGWSDEARQNVLWRNGQQVLAHTAVAGMSFAQGA